MSASTVAPLPVPVSVTAPVPVQGTPGRVAVDSLVVHRVSVITDQSKLVNTTDSTQSHNGGEVNAFFNSRQQSVNNQVGNSDCVSSRTANDFIVKEENNMDYTLSGNFGAGLPEQLSRPMSESTSASSIPRTHTPHMAGESIILLINVGSCGYDLCDSEKAFSFVEYGFMNEWKNRQILVCVVFSYITFGHGNNLGDSDQALYSYTALNGSLFSSYEYLCSGFLTPVMYEGCSESNLCLSSAANVGVGESSHM